MTFQKSKSLNDRHYIRQIGLYKAYMVHFTLVKKHTIIFKNNSNIICKCKK